MGFDQPDNTTRLLRLGVAKWIAPSEFSGEKVAPLLNALLTDPAVGSACAKYAALLKGDSALTRTCELLEDLGPAKAGHYTRSSGHYTRS
jgi:UDP:flavonoid glycosyltransferase YjiC (YdhE family)